MNNKGIVWGENNSGFRITNLLNFKDILLEEFGIRNLPAFIR